MTGNNSIIGPAEEQSHSLQQTTKASENQTQRRDEWDAGSAVVGPLSMHTLRSIIAVDE